MLVIQFSYIEKCESFHKYRKLHERSMITDFSYIEIVQLAFSKNQKY